MFLAGFGYANTFFRAGNKDSSYSEIIYTEEEWNEKWYPSEEVTE